jgi:deoxyadenosine/deoxycytidine kinase
LLANDQYVNFKVSGLERRIQNEKNQIYINLDREYRNKNNKAYGKALDEMDKFNKRYPTFAITLDDLTDSMEKRAEQRGQSWRGFTLNEKNAALLSDALAPSRRASVEAERKGRGE